MFLKQIVKIQYGEYKIKKILDKLYMKKKGNISIEHVLIIVVLILVGYPIAKTFLGDLFDAIGAYFENLTDKLFKIPTA